MVMLGKWERRVLGRDDDRHVVTVAGSRAGKSSTVLFPTCCATRVPWSCWTRRASWPAATAAQRRRMGQRVYVLDPFGKRACPRERAAHNPFAELGQGRPGAYRG